MASRQSTPGLESDRRRPDLELSVQYKCRCGAVAGGGSLDALRYDDVPPRPTRPPTLVSLCYQAKANPPYATKQLLWRK
eukprot:5098568-Pyramimonas_sp.AAC.2